MVTTGGVIKEQVGQTLAVMSTPGMSHRVLAPRLTLSYLALDGSHLKYIRNCILFSEYIYYSIFQNEVLTIKRKLTP